MESTDPALRVLVVAPRPLSLSKIPNRASAEALYEALEAQGNQVEAEWLWPASYASLVERLKSKEAPAVDILYLSAVAAEGEEGLDLCFEGEDDEANTVGVEELGALCGDAGIPLLILHSIGDIDAVGGSIREETQGLVSRFGLNVILLAEETRPQTLTEAATELLSSLLAEESLEQAAAEAQRVDDDARVLELLAAEPDASVVAASEPSSGVSKIIRFPQGDLHPAWKSLPSESEVGGLPPEPEHAFVGRGRELVQLEEALRKKDDDSAVWLCGYEGMGKTSLAAHVARWLVRTGRFERVVYTSFQGGGLPEWPLHNLGKRLVGDEFSPGREGALETVEDALAKTPTLILWDNVEAVLPGGAFALEAEERANLFQLAKRLAARERCALCVLSDTPGVPDAARTLEPLSVTLMLEPLHEENGLALLRAVSGTPEEDETVSSHLAELVNVLAGHPLALCVLGSMLEDGNVEEMMGGLEEIMPGIHEGQAHLRNGAVILALEYLMRSFDQDTRYALYGLGLFAGGFVDFLSPRLLDVEEETWERGRMRLASTQLLRTHRLAGINVPFVRLHPALSHHLARRLGSQQREQLEERYYGSYLGLLNWLDETETEYPDAAKMLARHELPNFRRGFEYILEAGNLNAAVTYMRHLQHFLNLLNLPAERDAIAERFQETASERVPAEGPLDRPAFQFLLGQSERLLRSGRVSQAGSLLQQLVQRMSEEDGLSYGGEEAALDQAAALHRFGQLLQNAQQAQAAYGAYQRALQSLEDVEGSETAQAERLALYQASAQVLLAGGQFQEAEEACRSGLEMAQDIDDREAMGNLNAQLADVALAQENLDDARANLETALIHFKAVDDKLNMARAWNRLGAVARQGPDLTEAQRCYEQALELTREADNAAYEAQALLRLAELAAEQKKPEKAKIHYETTIQIYEEHNQRTSLVATQMELAEFLLEQQKLEEARERAEAALDVAEDLGRRFNPWETYVLLQRIAEAEGDQDAEAEWRNRAREAFIRSPQAESVRRQWSGLIEAVAKSARGEALGAETVTTIEELESSEQWQELAGAIWRILGGERRDALYKGLDHVDGTIVHAILHAIEHPPSEQEDDNAGT